MKITDLQFREAMNLAPDAMLLVDETGQILFASQQVETLLGYRPADLLGQSIDLLLPDNLRSSHAAHRADYAVDPRTRSMGSGLELHARHQSGNNVPVEISLSPIPTAEGMVTCAAVRDISERSEAARLLVAARDAAGKALQSNSRFLAAASHDLRQPLQTMALLAHNLKRLVHEPAAKAPLDNLVNAVHSASRLLIKLLDISRLEAGGTVIDLGDHSIRTVLQPLYDDFRPMIAEKGLALRVDVEDVRIHTDPTLLDQLIRNLMSNAVKFTAQGAIALRGVVSGQQLVVDVIDSGIGINANDLPNIFDDFYQVTRSGLDREGYGLGLGIVRRLANALGAELGVQSTVGKGTTFTVKIPLVSAQVSPATKNALEPATVHAPPIDEQPTASTATTLRVLLVDDDAAVRDATNLLLELEGYTVLSAIGLDDALKQCATRGGPDLLLSDYHLENDVTGVHVLQQIRRLYGQEIPAIFVTGDTSQIELPRKDMTLTQLLRKPVEPDTLVRTIRATMAK